MELDGGSDEDADTVADSAIPDDEDDFDDIASRASQPSTSPPLVVQASSRTRLPSCGSSLLFF